MELKFTDLLKVLQRTHEKEVEEKVDDVIAMLKGTKYLTAAYKLGLKVK